MIDSFCNMLKKTLPSSDQGQRKAWANYIVQNDIDLKGLCESMLIAEQKIASRFLWLLSDIGQVSPTMLYGQLPYLFLKSKQVKELDFSASLAKYWHLYGIPPETEGEATTILFEWLMSPDVKVNTKGRVVRALFKLTGTYPELKTELKSCLEIQQNQNSPNFKKLALKILDQL